MKRPVNSYGFTLMEFLVVLSIVAVMVAIIVPVAQTSFEKMRIHQTQADIAKLEIAIEAYKSQNGKYPDPSPAESIPVIALSPYMKFPEKRVISNVFYDPWSQPFYYDSSGTNHADFVDISSAGPDREIDGNWQTSATGINADNIDNWSRKR